ncbi:uncharacterized protein BDR25DRAFT_129593 [Lindgomyces ingoldianus]|uniref:Uncharacterized protein n=1 Tax=Lindgomyces ingoldianus TaxID=673940 RepID=A0ACB6R231_9PLEO|nr:uncharacterized protein BDR25DRAFT_129593 [Lindgomyces ingoldianus]KAF2473201.1 hypothetical protein BDR25DRAFT_129593 [Lindgomyces ingoldianus]
MSHAMNQSSALSSSCPQPKQQPPSAASPAAETAPKRLHASIVADARPRLVARASESSPARPRCSLVSKSSSAVPTLSTTHRFLPTYWLPTTMTAAGGVNPTAADLLRQAMVQR